MIRATARILITSCRNICYIYLPLYNSSAPFLFSIIYYISEEIELIKKKNQICFIIKILTMYVSYYMIVLSPLIFFYLLYCNVFDSILILNSPNLGTLIEYSNSNKLLLYTDTYTSSSVKNIWVLPVTSINLSATSIVSIV